MQTNKQRTLLLLLLLLLLEHTSNMCTCCKKSKMKTWARVRAKEPEPTSQTAMSTFFCEAQLHNCYGNSELTSWGCKLLVASCRGISGDLSQLTVEKLERFLSSKSHARVAPVQAESCCRRCIRIRIPILILEWLAAVAGCRCVLQLLLQCCCCARSGISQSPFWGELNQRCNFGLFLTLTLGRDIFQI